MLHLWPGVPTGGGGGQRGGGVVRAAEARGEGGVVVDMARLGHLQQPSALPSSPLERLSTGTRGKVQVVKLSEIIDLNYLHYLHTLQFNC